ncbi:MAG TPA: VWA domain-containing protein [Spirochaetota bacterium]|nr:VWA domain-containing protein [Spirochaetota bacterium]HNT10742.1 VWA domain-containing protein [Spirochaetota bacterium]
MISAYVSHKKINKKFYDFIDILKDAGVPVSTAETLDLFTALGHVGFDDRHVFRQTLRTSLVKDYTDIPVFDRCFDAFFGKKGPAKGSDLPSAVAGAMEMESLRDEGLSEQDLDSLTALLDDFIESLDDAIFFERTYQEILTLFLEDPVVASSSGALGMLIFNTRSRGQHGPMGDSGQRPDETINLNQVMLRQISRRVDERKIGTQIKDREQYLLNKFIYQLKPDEVKEMKELVRRFGQKLKNRISLRKKRVKHGGIDVKRTIRKNLQFGGTPFKIYHKDRKIDRPQLVVLCDISGSVNQYSRFMLLLTYTLQSLFSKVRTFAFISNMVEITPLFMEMNPDTALNSIFGDTDFTYGWGSNYGRCFNMFVREYSDSLTSKTTVLVLGDARNNNQDPGLESFIKITERTRNVFWLNPEKRHLWDWNDSIASIYREQCTEMREVNSFIDLSEFIDKLFTR